MLLKFDILREIAWSSDRQTCAALIRSCRFFYQEAAKCILHHPVDLSSWLCDVSKFVRFLGAQPCERARYVRELHLGVHCLSISTEDLRDLENAIAQMTRLEYLAIEEGEEVFESLGKTLAGLTSLRRLQVDFAGSHTCDFLRALKADLNSISLEWRGSNEGWFVDQGMTDEEWSAFHPVSFLAIWRSTLEELTCHSWLTAPKLPVFTYVYPNMHRLSIEHDDFPLVAPYIRAYPNLARLSIYTGHIDDIESPGKLERLRQHRAINVSSRQVADGPGTWRHLDEYDGSLVDLYLLGLTCRISRVALSGLTQTREEHLELLSAVLSYAQPLHLNLEGDAALLGHPTRSLPVILTRSGASCLESLVLRIDLRAANMPLYTGATLDALVSALVKLPLRRLRLRVFDQGMHPMPWLPDSSSSEDDSESEAPQTPRVRAKGRGTMQELDIDAFMRALTAELPSLTDALVEFISPRGSGRRRRTIPPERVDIPAEYDHDMYEIR